MKRLALLSVLALFAGCASPGRPPRDPVTRQWAKETFDYQRADVAAEVEEAFRKGDLKFKGWVKSAADTVVWFPGITVEEAATLRAASLAAGEVLFIEDLVPFLVGDDMGAQWQRRNTALFDYMLRYNRALFEKLVREGRVQKLASQ